MRWSQLRNNFRKDLKAAQAMRLSWWGVLCTMIPALPVVIFLNHVGRLNMALPILGSMCIFGFLIVLKWRRRGNAWFWITILTMAVVPILIIWSIPWTDRWVSPLLS
jgi:hypothetical protein